MNTIRKQSIVITAHQRSFNPRPTFGIPDESAELASRSFDVFSGVSYDEDVVVTGPPFDHHFVLLLMVSVVGVGDNENHFVRIGMRVLDGDPPVDAAATEAMPVVALIGIARRVQAA